MEEMKAYTLDFPEKTDAPSCITAQQYFPCLTLTYTRVRLTVNCKLVTCVLSVQVVSFSRRF